MFLKDIPFIISLIRNSRRTSISRKMLGHSIKRRIGPVTSNDILLYAEATLDSTERYRHAGCNAPSFYLSSLLYPMFRYFLINRELGLNLLRLVHGQQRVEWSGPIREGDMLDIEMSLHDISDSPAGEMITLRTVVSSQGKKIAVSDSVFIIRGGSTGRGKTGHGLIYGNELFRRTIPTEENQQLRYAEVSGDGNFIHTNRFLARLAGLPGTIMHGVCIAAMVSNSLLDELLGGDMSRMKSISMRFANPVFPGESITLIGYDSGFNGTIFFNAFNSSGRAVIKNGEYSYEAKQNNYGE